METIEVVKEFIEEKKEAIKDLPSILKGIAKRVRDLLGEKAKVYIFGSYVKGDFQPLLSDIDILIVSEKIKNMDDRAKISLKIKEGLKGRSMFEIHLVNEKEFEWYKFFVDKMVEIKA
jgi:hypothetical protein